MTQFSTKYKAHHVKIDSEHDGRRIDNFLSGQLKGVPKARLYKMLRKGEVRVNSARIKQDHRLKAGDDVRIPPSYVDKAKYQMKPSLVLQHLLENSILYEDDTILALNKPAGMVVHSGSGQSCGLIEVLRQMRPDIPHLELVHRLDKFTSGCLLVAKDHRILRELHEALRNNRVEKIYLTLLKGRLKNKKIDVHLPLQRNVMRAGERMVQVNKGGKQAQSRFLLEKYYSNTSLVRAHLITGRTHQIRVHSAHIGHPVAGDVKYGDPEFNKQMRKLGLRRLFLHAESIEFYSPSAGKQIKLKAPLADELALVLKDL